MTRYHVTLITLMSMPMPVYSGTIVESIDQNGETAITRFEDGNIRTDTGQPGVYVLLNFQQEKAYLVDDSQRMVMDMSSQMWGEDQGTTDGAAKQPKPRLVEQGKGPTIAGYITVHYKVMAGDEFCGDEYLSSKAMKESNMQQFGEAMSRMSRQQEQMSGMTGMMQNPCDAAELTLYESYLQHGMPMRSVDRDGTVNNEVKRIQSNVSISKDYFELPRDYQVMNMEEMMQRHMMTNQQQMQNMPDMSNMPGMSDMDMGDMQKMREQIEQQMQQMMQNMGKQPDAGNQ